ncbi:helicase-related protein [Rhodococcus zopfii]|uniref:helicase-related protein n=1 Tax=Rhodococcus zopfii TaxID=43772 RepID=UPI00111158A7|nr:helicase-related protein [Rhodococcus zopfii]
MPRRLSDHLRVTLDNTFAEDWARQRRAAGDILERLDTQEGVVLADQVGMGKTYVALAVAVSEILRTARPGQVVVFAPPRVAAKWVDEWGKFRESLLVDGPEIRCVPEPIRSGEGFLEALDAPAKTRSHLVVVTHSALTTTLKDSFIQLALLHYAIRGRWGAGNLRSRVAKWSDGAKGLIGDRRFTPELVQHLLVADPEHWRAEWERLTGADLGTDPVPLYLREVAQQLELDALRDVISDLPIFRSRGIDARLKQVRVRLNDATQAVWKQVLVMAKPRLPLLIVDEAHALKNDRTRISRLFSPIVDSPEDGALCGIFDRMLLLTATPFELGHNELIGILKRLGAIRPMRPGPLEPLSARLDRLRAALQHAQETAVTFDESWSRLGPRDVAVFDSWAPNAEAPANAGAEARRAWRDGVFAVRAREAMHTELRPWIIRHERAHRRDYHAGSTIRPGDTGDGSVGLEIPDEAALPFLLAARAQAVADVDHSGAARPLFAYGIASSYETYLRLDVGEGVDTADEAEEDGAGAAEPEGTVSASAAQWYHGEIRRLLESGSRRREHPKVAATVERATDLWLSGQKCLIFCWYIRTTDALLNAVRQRLDDTVRARAAVAFDVDEAAAEAELDRLSHRLLTRDTPSYRSIRGGLLRNFAPALAGDGELADALADIAIRNLRTHAYLIRYTDLSPRLDAEGLLAGLAGENPARVNLLARWSTFAVRLAAMTVDERTKVLMRLQGEGHGAEDNARGVGRGARLDQVRRAYGGTNREARERLISVFNTPFAPDILVASSVMGEGIDLHHECRHVIHYDLDWNPSKLEQRTGRLDRIGALAEREKKNIEVYEPYLAGTHDEKMFRVVKDRAGWFDIVMGRATAGDERTTDAEEARVPLHPRVREALSMDLTSR